MFRTISLMALIAFTTVACADANNSASESSVAQAELPKLVDLRAKLANAINPNVTLGEFEESDLSGFYYVSVGQGRGLYVSKDGNNVVAGDVFQLTDDNLVNLGELRAIESRKPLVASIDPNSEIVFSPTGEKKATIHVFTDVDCGYCRKLHSEIDSYLAEGIEVRYLGYPRSGLGTPSYDKLTNAWCAADKNRALTSLKAGQQIPTTVCDANPVADHFALGGRMGVTGTPAILLDDGRLLPGYRPASVMAAELGI